MRRWRTVSLCFAATFLALVGGAAVRGDDAEALAAAKRSANEVGQATLKGEASKIVDATPEALVGLVGGSRDEAIATVQRTFEAAKAKKITIKEFKVDMPSKLYKTESHCFAIVPTSVDLDSPQGTIRGKSFLLGISADGGKAWKFVDSNALTRNKEKVLEILPKLPADLKLPERAAPEIIPN